MPESSPSCERCGGPLPERLPGTPGRRRKWCSDECKRPRVAAKAAEPVEDDEPTLRNPRTNMIRAVNRELGEYPAEVEGCATAELARQLAREFDAGDRPAAGPLMRALKELRLMAGAAKAPQKPDEVEEAGPDELDNLRARRADRLARAAGVVVGSVGDDRRPGGRRSG